MVAIATVIYVMHAEVVVIVTAAAKVAVMGVCVIVVRSLRSLQAGRSGYHGGLGPRHGKRDQIRSINTTNCR